MYKIYDIVYSLDLTDERFKSINEAIEYIKKNMNPELKIMEDPFGGLSYHCGQDVFTIIEDTPNTVFTEELIWALKTNLEDECSLEDIIEVFNTLEDVKDFDDNL